MGTHTPKIAALIGEKDAVIYIDEPPSLNVLEVKFMLPESDEFLGSVIERYNGWDEQQAKIDELVKALNEVEVIAAGEQHYNNRHQALIKIENVAKAALTRAKVE